MWQEKEICILDSMGAVDGVSSVSYCGNYKSNRVASLNRQRQRLRCKLGPRPQPNIAGAHFVGSMGICKAVPFPSGVVGSGRVDQKPQGERDDPCRPLRKTVVRSHG